MEDLSEKELRELAEAWAGLRGLAYGHKLLGGLFFIIALWCVIAVLFKDHHFRGPLLVLMASSALFGIASPVYFWLGRGLQRFDPAAVQRRKWLYWGQAIVIIGIGLVVALTYKTISGIMLIQAGVWFSVAGWALRSYAQKLALDPRRCQWALTYASQHPTRHKFNLVSGICLTIIDLMFFGVLLFCLNEWLIAPELVIIT